MHRTAGEQSRRWWARSGLAALIATLFSLLIVTTAAAASQTVVSLTFDNGIASQYTLRSTLAAHGMHGTFLISSDNVGSNSYYLTWSQLRDLASDGNEIGGNGLDLENLTTLSTSQAQHQVCDDRTALIGEGFSISSFAYPYSATNPTVESIVKNCGYAVARTQGLFDPNECDNCAFSNSIPPTDAYKVLGSSYLPQPYALSDLEGWVSRAQSNGGGWVPIVFDDVCDSCGTASSVSSATFQSFLDWLAQQPNTVVKTMRQVVPPPDTTPPQTTIACNGGDCGQTFQNSVSVTLAATDPDSGVSSTHYTTDGSVPTLQSPTYTGPLTLTDSTTLQYRSWDPNGNVEAVHSQYVHVTSPTVVSLTFDDGIATQYQARTWLASYGMHGTFFINSGKVGSSSYYMTWSQIHDIASGGNEIGGHTVDHPDLTTLTLAQAKSEICDDRTALINQGFTPPSSFAYPFSATNPSIEALVQQCGYTEGRLIGGLNDPTDCASCPFAESIPPPDPYRVRTPIFLNRPITPQDLEGWVTQGEDNGGGWVPLVFHDICDSCDSGAESGSITPGDLQTFLAWLAARAPQTVVKTVRQVMPPNPPGIPSITSTSPTSPSNDDTPNVIGTLGSGSPTTQVELFANGTCTGSPTTTGTASQFTGGGVTVSVPDNATTSISAVAVDAAGDDSNCSSPISYTEDSTAPAAPTLSSTNPASPANNNSPMLLGTAESGSTVKIYTNSGCTGTPVATGTAAALASGITLTVGNNTTTSFRATATDAAGNTSTCSSPISYTEDSTAPAAPSLTSTNPASPANNNSPKLVGSAESGSTVKVFTSSDCSGTPVATGTAAGLGSPGITLTVGDDTTTSFRATATDAAGNTSVVLKPDLLYRGFDRTGRAEPHLDQPRFASEQQHPDGARVSGGRIDREALYNRRLHGHPSGDRHRGRPGLRDHGHRRQRHHDQLPRHRHRRRRATPPSARARSATPRTRPRPRRRASPRPTPRRPRTTTARNWSGPPRAARRSKCLQARIVQGPPWQQAPRPRLASPGISVTVGNDTTTSFRATATDAAGNTSTCSSPISLYGGLDRARRAEPHLDQPRFASEQQHPEAGRVSGGRIDGQHLHHLGLLRHAGRRRHRGHPRLPGNLGHRRQRHDHQLPRDGHGRRRQHLHLLEPDLLHGGFDRAGGAEPHLDQPGVAGEQQHPEAVGSAEGGLDGQSVYNSSDCTGTPVATGTAATLASPGITVTVGNDTTTSFRATATDAAGNTSTCSSPITLHGGLDRARPRRASPRPTPPRPANNNSPKLIGSAESGSTVKVFTSSDCSGTPVATGTAAGLALTGYLGHRRQRHHHQLPCDRHRRRRQHLHLLKPDQLHRGLDRTGRAEH